MLIDLAARLKFRWDLGQSFLSVAQFAVVVIAASDKLERITGLSFPAVISIMMPLSFAGVFVLGWVLDHWGYWQKYQTLSNDRNPAIQKLLRQQTTSK